MKDLQLVVGVADYLCLVICMMPHLEHVQESIS